ncbi:MAG: phycobilisome linker polypeptide [Cyanobacteriota bacterium]|nr:phycobilisome linker polypeptide [Cyanobacteriota bacterium]
MLGQSALVGTTDSPSNGRIFVYEVTGLRPNTENDGNSYPFRSSSSIFINVPYKRMNEEMQRITRMGGTIVSIKPLGADSSSDE